MPRGMRRWAASAFAASACPAFADTAAGLEAWSEPGSGVPARSEKPRVQKSGDHPAKHCHQRVCAGELRRICTERQSKIRGNTPLLPAARKA